MCFWLWFSIRGGLCFVADKYIVLLQRHSVRARRVNPQVRAKFLKFLKLYTRVYELLIPCSHGFPYRRRDASSGHRWEWPLGVWPGFERLFGRCPGQLQRVRNGTRQDRAEVGDQGPCGLSRDRWDGLFTYCALPDVFFISFKDMLGQRASLLGLHRSQLRICM